jgi:hypothetical protein
MCLSSERSASIRFKRAFSSSSDRSFRNSLTPRWAYSFPEVERGFVDAQVPAQTSACGVPLDLAEGVSDLLFGELRLLRGLRSLVTDRPKPLSSSSLERRRFRGRRHVRHGSGARPLRKLARSQLKPFCGANDNGVMFGRSSAAGRRHCEHSPRASLVLMWSWRRVSPVGGP